jgi:outer membrane receptor protein involved in Fe transport
LNQIPSAVTYYATPYDVRAALRPNLGAYVQDQWTQKRLTVNGGLRFDWFKTGYPTYSVPATQYVPQREVVGSDVLNWKDLNPRLGASYDLFGNGRTAVKASFSRYVVQAVISSLTSTANPISASNNNNTRSWNDLNGDYAITGDL